MRNALVVVALVFVMVGGSLLVSGGRSITRERQFARDAVPADGMILTKQIRATRLEATYRFRVAEGVFDSRARLTFVDWFLLNEGQPVEVLYLPDRPSSSRLGGPQRWKALGIIALVGGVLLAAGVAFLERSRRQARRRGATSARTQLS